MLLLLTFSLLLPFLNKPLHIDDPMYVWTAQRIVEHPIDFYGQDVNWCYTTRPMALANDNPPLVSYWLAAVGALFGWSEPVLHAAMLVPALLAVVGVWFLALRLEAPPLLAGLGLLAMPGFLVSSTTLMADVLATALWTWSLLSWVTGIKEQRLGWLVAGALLTSLCVLTKFLGLELLPLLFAYTLLKTRRLDRRVLLLGVPLTFAFAYRARMLARYGVDPFTAIGSYALWERGAAKAGLLELPWLGLAYLGGACLPALLLVGSLFRARGWALCAAFLLSVGVGLLFAGTFGGYALRTEEGTRFNLVLHLALFVTCGAIVLALVAAYLQRERTPEAILMGLWVAGIFLFGSFLNWTTNIRSLLPATPAVAIVLAREIGLKNRGGGIAIPLTLLGFSTLVGLIVAQGDLAYARTAREAASAVMQEFGRGGRGIWFEGSWGFQYYMNLDGASKLDVDHLDLLAGDRIVRPSSNTCLSTFPPAAVRPGKDYTFPLHALASTMTGGAGFYSHILGVVPYVFGIPPIEVYSVSYLHANIRSR